MEHARYLYDALLPFGPVLAALSCATPFYRSMIANTDLRWNVIWDSVDSRTEHEINEKILPKSRYSGVNHYISDHPYFINEGLADVIQIPFQQEHVDWFVDEGIPLRLAKHFAWLFS